MGKLPCSLHPINPIDEFLQPPRKDGECRQCRREVMHNHYENNKDKIKQRCRIWRQNNPEKVLEYRRNELAASMKRHGMKASEQIVRCKESLKMASDIRQILIRINEIEKLYEIFKGHAD